MASCNNKSFTMKKYIFIIGFLIFPFEVFSATFPLEITYPRFGPIGLPSFLTPEEFLPRYIDYIYRVSGIVIAVLGFFALVLGAALYIASAGNVGRQIEARERIFGALVGVLIFAASFALLKFFHTNLTQIQLAQLQMNFVEVEEGVWLCNQEIRVLDPYLSDHNRNVFLTFENYILIRDFLKKDWLEGRLDPKIQKVITSLVDAVKRECIRFNTSAEIPPGFRYPKWLYIVGNYGAILHSFPNFKGYCGPPFLLNTKIDLESAYTSANSAYEDLALARRIQSTDPNIQVSLPAFEIPFGDEIPKFSINVFSDFRLNYADHLLNPASLHSYYPRANATTTITFYTFRNFHEDLDTSFQQATSVCPRLSATSTTSATPTQPCLKEIEVTLRSYLASSTHPVTTINLSLRLPNQTKTIQVRGVEFGERWEVVDLDSCYSFKIEPPSEEEIREGWIVIVYASSTEPEKPTDVLLKPYFWCDVFNKSDRNLEDNYVSYFCEDKTRAKRYPCVYLVSILPGVVLKPE
jgi:hypothetical protein